MDEGVRTLIDKLEDKIRALKQARDTLIEQFGDAPPSGNHRRKNRKSGRRDEVIAFLRKNEPVKSVDIVAQTGIPIGTLGGILKDKKTFARDGESKWSLIKDNA